MTGPSSPSISTRKEPKQARSTGLVAAILDAAAQVLAREGARRFTTARVAERAGVSVGSIYQYFPSKAALLFRLQSDEWRRTIADWARILGNPALPPPERLRELIHAFLRSEIEEAALRGALDDSAPLYRDAPEAQAILAEGDRIFAAFIREYLPGLPDAQRQMAGDLVMTTVTAVSKEYSETPRSPVETQAWADAMADMLCNWLQSPCLPNTGQPHMHRA